MDVCPDCYGRGEVNAAWEVTKWRMKPCERCDGTGTVPEQTPQEILIDYLLDKGKEIGVAEEEAEQIVNLFIRRGITMMRPSTLQELEAEARESAATQSEDHSEIVRELRDMASRRRQALPDSPQAATLDKAAELLEDYGHSKGS